MYSEFNSVKLTLLISAVFAIFFSPLSLTEAEAQNAPSPDRPTVSITGPKGLQPPAFWVTIRFSEAVTGFEQGDVTVGNGSVVKFSGEQASYRAKIRAASNGTVTVDVAENVAENAAGGGNTAASRFSVEADPTRPEVAITGPAGTQTGPFDVTISFSESVTGFERGDVTVDNGSVTAFSGSGTSYRATIDPAAGGTVTVKVAAHVATDRAGNPNFPASRSQQAELEAPNALPVITRPGDKSYEQGEAISSFGITVTDADQDPVTVSVTGLPSGLSHTNGEVRGTVSDNAAAQDYSVTIKADDGVNAAVKKTFTITVTEPAPEPEPTPEPEPAPALPARPTVSITGPKGLQPPAFWVTITFSEPVTGFAEGDVTVGNGSVVKFSGEQASYRAKIRAATNGTVTVDVAENVAENAAGGGNTAASRFSVESDPTRPEVAMTGPAGTQTGPFDVTISFSESVTGFERGDVTVDNGSVTAFSGSGTSYRATIDPAAGGTVTVKVAAHVAADRAGNPNFPASRSQHVKLEPSNAAPVITNPGDKTYERGETITPFGITVTAADGDDVTVTLTGLPSGLTYTNGQVQGTVGDDAVPGDHTVTIQADDGGDAPVVETFTITVKAARAKQGRDQTRPTVAISGPTGVQKGGFTVTITFSESVTGFEQSEVTVGNGTVTSFAGSGSVATVIITPTASGTVTVDVAENVATAGDGDGNTAATRYSVEADLDAPTVTISGPTTSQSGPFDVTITFSEAVTGLEQADVTVGNGDVTAFSGSGSSYAVSIAPTVAGTVTVDVDAGVAVDGAGNGNTAASRFSVSVSVSRPTTKLESNADPNEEGPFSVTITFSAPVTGFEVADVTVTNGQKGQFHLLAEDTTYAVYQLFITPTATGTVTVDVAANVAVDEHGNGNTVAPRLSVPVSVTRPQPVITAPTGVQTGPFDVTVTFSESVTGFEKSDIGVDGGSVTAFSGSGASYAATITPTVVTGSVTLSVHWDKAVDADGNGNTYALSVQVSVDRTVPAAPTLTRTRFNAPTNPALDVTWSAPVAGSETITGYEARHRRSGGAWIDYAGALGANSTSFNVPDLEPGAVYEAQVRALKDGVPGPWSRTGSGRANSPPKLATYPPPYPTFTVSWKDTYEKELRGHYTDADGDSFTYSVKSLDPGFIEAWISGGSVFVRILNPGNSKIRITAYDPYGGVGPDLCPNYFGLARVTRSVPENSPAGTAVGAPVVGKPYNGVTLSHWLDDIADDDTATSDFVVDAATGQVRVKQGAALDYETKSSYTGRVYWGRVQNRHAFALLTINVTDVDDKDASPAVTISDASAAEGDEITFTVRLDKAVSGGLAVTPSFTDGTATKGTDYTENTAAIKFTGTAGETQTFTVATTEDADAELDETFTVGLTVSGTTETVTATDTATGTIINDDGAVPAVTIEDASAAEGDSITFTVTLDKAVSGGLTVTPSFTDGTATEGTDYAENTAAITFAGTAGEQQTFTVATTEDTDAEADETFTVGLTVSGTSESVTASDTATGTIINDDTPAVTIADASASEGDSITFTVTLDAAVTGGLTVTPSFTDGTATEGTDYTENTAAITFAGTAGEQQTFTVATTEDTDAEADETFTVGLTVSGTSESVTASDTATGTIINDDTPAVTIADASASEGDSITFTVTLDAAVTGGLAVTPSFTDGTATKGTDYTENTAAIKFTGTAGEQQTFTVATTEDTDVEAHETFTVSLAVSGTSETVTASDTATATIIDDDGATSVTVTDASDGEGDSLTFTVTLSKAVAGGVTVTPSFTDGTATKSTDYTENTAAITFAGAAGEQQTFTVATTEDTDVEADETFTVGLAVSGTSETVTASDTAAATIIDDDAPAVTIADASASEGDSMTFTVTLDAAVTGGFSVTPSFTDGTATEGTDYTENTAALTFAGTAGETQTFTVATTEDTDAELDETFTVGLTVSGTTETVTATDTATGTITNDDGAVPAVTIEDASAAEGDSITFTVTLDKAVSGGLAVTPSFTDVTATEGTDYSENTGTLTFTGTAGEEQTFSVATHKDEDDEDDETFTVSLFVSGTSATVASDTATGTVTDDQMGHSPAAVTVADASADEGDSITFTVTLDKAVSGGLTVTPSFTDVTATEGTDYTGNTAAITFAGTSGETQTFTVATIEDTEGESDETFTVGLAVSGLSGTETVTTTDTATGTIVDDESPALTIADASASEGDSLTFTVTLDKAAAGGLTVAPSFTDGTATKGTDYTENTAAVTFTGTAGETQTFTVATTEDTDPELDETFTVGLTVTTARETIAATDTATGTITNDDGAVAAVTIEDASAAEGDQITFTVSLDKAVSGGLTVTPSFTDGTATKSTDYTENTAAITFAGTTGETQTFTVATIEDTVGESDETFTVSLTVSGTQATVTASDTATGTITNDDGASNVPPENTIPSVTIEDASADEGEAVTFTVTLDAALSGGLTVTPGFTDGTATDGTDYTANTGALTFTGNAGETQSFTVATREDTDEERDETFTVGLTVSGTQETVTATDTATGTINDDDSDTLQAPAEKPGNNDEVTISLSGGEATEGDDVVFTVTLSQALDTAVTVYFNTADGTARTPEDYGEWHNVKVPVQASQTSATVAVTTVENTVIEDDETFTATITAVSLPAGVRLDEEQATATGTIIDNDRTTVSISGGEATEGDDVVFTVALSKALDTAVTVYFNTADGTASAPGDYRAQDRIEVTVPASETGATVAVPTIDDERVEGDESFTATIAALSLPAGVILDKRQMTAAGTITDNDKVTVSLSGGEATEGAEAIFMVSLTRPLHAAVTVSFSTADGTASAPGDYVAQGRIEVTVPASETSATVAVPTLDDERVEGDESFTATIAELDLPPGVSLAKEQATAAGTIMDNDEATVSLNDGEGTEGDDVVFTVVLSQALDTPTAVSFSTADGTASAPGDYVAQDRIEVTVPASETSATVAVPTLDDERVEGDESFTATIAELDLPPGVSLAEEQATAAGTITDNDEATVSLNGGEATEGDDVVFTVVLSQALDTPTAVNFSAADGTASAPRDYRAQGRIEVTVPVSETSATVAVPTVDDERVEGDESFTATIAALDLPPGVSLAEEQATAAGTITDNDEATVSLNGGEATEGDDVVFTVALSQALDTAVTVYFSTADGTASAPGDYRAQGRIEVTVPASETGATVAVPTLDDERVEGDESFTATIAALDLPSGVSLAGEQATATIIDNDEATVSIIGGEAVEGEDVIFTVSLTRPLHTAVTVSFSTADGTASAPEDYSAQDGTHVMIEAGESSAIMTVPTLDDTHIEEDETFTVTIAAVSVPAGVTFDDSAGTATIIDDDTERRSVLESTLALTGKGMLSNVADLGIWSQPCLEPETEARADHAAARLETEARAQRAATNVSMEMGHMADFEDQPEYRSGTINLEELLYNRSFVLSLPPASAGDGQRCRMIWGMTGFRHFQAGSQDSGSRQDGDLKSGWLGMDLSINDRWIAGLALSHNEGTADYSSTYEGSAESGRFKTRLSAVHPYLRRLAGADDPLGIWAMLGLGTGEARDRPEGGVNETSDLSMLMGAAGLRWRLAASETPAAVAHEGRESTSRRELSLIGDIGVAHLKTDGGDLAIDDLEAIASRVRFGVEFSQTGALRGNATLTRLAELSGFWDGGDGETGFGVSAAAGLRYAGSRIGLEARASGSTSDDYHEYGLNLAAKYADRHGRGVTVALTPSWRMTNIGGAGALPLSRASFDQGVGTASVNTATGSLGGNHGLAGNDNRSLKLGVHFHFPSRNTNRRFDLELTGEHTDNGVGADPGYRLGLALKGLF